MSHKSLRSFLRTGGRFACLYALLLGLGMAFVIAVGSIMGDCSPGPGCHENDQAVIGGGLLRALPIILMFSAAAWLILAAVRALLHQRISPAKLNPLLTLMTLALVWISFEAAFELHFWWKTSD